MIVGLIVELAVLVLGKKFLYFVFFVMPFITFFSNRGSFYILKCGKEMMNQDPIIVKSGVSLSNVGCYCLIEGSCGVPWIVYVELSGKIMYLELLCGMKDSARKTSNSFHPTLPDYDEEEETKTNKKVFAVVEERVPPNSLSMCSSPENGQV